MSKHNGFCPEAALTFKDMSKGARNPPAAHPSRKALILGSRSVASLIARELQDEGFETELQKDHDDPPLPSVGDPDALAKLRAVFERFARESPQAGGFANCIHPGVSSWAERPELPIIAQEFGLDVICPPTQVLALFSNKLNLLGEAERSGIPNLVLSFDPMHSVREIERMMVQSRQHFPVVLKSVWGSGSFGACIAYELDELGKKLALWIEQLRRKTGEVIIFSERYLEGARHISIPFARFPDGRTELFPSLDVSLQSRFRKVVEVCPAISVDPNALKRAQDWTLSFAEHCRYIGVGTLEFLIEGPRAFLVDGSARLNTAFPLWERVAGTKAVSWQLAAMETGTLSPPPERTPRPEWATGISLRLLAEDSLLQLPQPGRIQELSNDREWRFKGSEAELHLNVTVNSEISPSGSETVGNLLVGGRDFKQAVTIAQGILNQFWIAGSLQTNERFLVELLSHPWVREGIFCAGFVDEEFAPAVRPPAEILRILGSICSLHPKVIQLSRVSRLANVISSPESRPAVRWAVGDQWVSPDVSIIKWVNGPEFWGTADLPGISGTVKLSNGQEQRVCEYPIAPVPEGKWQVRIGHWVLMVRRISAPRKNREPRALALVSGKVHSVLYREGVTIPAHETFLIIESLGILVPHASPIDFQVSEWKVRAEDPVSVGQDLAKISVPEN